jgi:hypothetical protein
LRCWKWARALFLLVVHLHAEGRRLGARYGDGRFKSQLQLGFGCTIKLLVDRRVVTVESNICTGGIRETLEPIFVVGRNTKEDPKLYREWSDHGQGSQCVRWEGWSGGRVTHTFCGRLSAVRSRRASLNFLLVLSMMTLTVIKVSGPTEPA